jgi:hypothetical protein
MRTRTGARRVLRDRVAAPRTRQPRHATDHHRLLPVARSSQELVTLRATSDRPQAHRTACAH